MQNGTFSYLTYLGSDGQPYRATAGGSGTPDLVGFQITGPSGNPSSGDKIYFTGFDNNTYFAQGIIAIAPMGAEYSWRFWRVSNPGGPHQDVVGMGMFDENRRPMNVKMQRGTAGIEFVVTDP